MRGGSRRSATISRCPRCSCRCFRRGSWASPSRPSPSARWCRPRSCRSPAPISSRATSTANTSIPNCSPAHEAQVAKIASLVVKLGALCLHRRCCRRAEIRHQAAAAGRHLDHPDLAVGADRALHALASSDARCWPAGPRASSRARRWWPPRVSRARSIRSTSRRDRALLRRAQLARAQSRGERGAELRLQRDAAAAARAATRRQRDGLRLKISRSGR